MPPIAYQGKGRNSAIRIVANQKDFDRAIKYLDRWKHQYASKYVRKVMYQAAKIPVSRMKAVTPVLSGDLRKSIRARNNKLEIKELGAATVGPDPRRKGRHRHLYVIGTKPHSLAGGSGKRAGKGKYSMFPDRGVPYNLKKVPASMGPSRHKDGQSRNGMMFVAYNPWLKHPGSPPHGQLDTVWNANKPRITSFVQGEVAKLAQGGYTGVDAFLREGKR